ncbi:MAG: hypothetical protein HFG30_01270 [Eubacterium sp.]|nr:hypothetical protein [Eubacterium sp.]
MKKIVLIFLSIALVFSVISVNNISVSKINAQENDWSSTAITVPAEGELVGAGYIDVEFNNSMEGYTYTVYLDGEPMYWVGDDIVRTEIGEQITEDAVVKSFTSQDKGKTEVYTTNVSRHELVVKANNGSDEQVSETRTFYVSKKGMALGGDMSDKVSLKKLNCSWYYNWATDAFNNSIDEGVDHIPMMWGGADDNKEGMANMSSTANYILGFNEPDIGTQANMLFFNAIDTWKEYISPLNMRKVSPAPAAPGGDSRWLKQFMNGDYKCKSPWDDSWGLYSDYMDDETKTWVDGMNDDVDAVCLHYYRSEINVEGLLAAIKTLWETYHKPIWVTELSIFGRKGTSVDFSYEIDSRRAEMAEFVRKIVENLDDIPYVERYCWFSYDIDSTNEIDAWNGSGATAMFEYASGTYTELGRLYSSIGNPEGYKAETITDDEMFVYVPEETTTAEVVTTEKVQETDKKVPITTVASTTKKVVKPAKVKLSKIQNVKKKSVKLVWKKVSGATKYQIQYAMNKKFTKKLKRKTTKKVTLKIAKLTKNKKYYFRVRAINKIGNGKWSNIKSVKIKK